MKSLLFTQTSVGARYILLPRVWEGVYMRLYVHRVLTVHSRRAGSAPYPSPCRTHSCTRRWSQYSGPGSSPGRTRTSGVVGAKRIRWEKPGHRGSLKNRGQHLRRANTGLDGKTAAEEKLHKSEGVCCYQRRCVWVTYVWRLWAYCTL